LLKDCLYTISILKFFAFQNMKRIDFLRKVGLGVIATSGIACVSKVVADGGTSANNTGSTNGSSVIDCSITNAETAGPFPTKSPTTLAYTDIRLDRKGIELKLNITIKNKNTGCGPLKDAFVDIWHCDAAGNYSEYNSFGSAHFLRGRQTTDSAGLTKFISIFPGWYRGRATHIHIHVFNAAGKSLLVSQIAFPSDICENVFKNATDLYKNGSQDTSNEQDGIFNDGFANEMPSVSGSIKDGYILNHTIVVNA
jgi:protocatechuate 3,4-dioxygenase beta subunit